MTPNEMNSPKEIVEILRPMIEGKTVCDLGAGDGEFMVALSKYATVVGVEHITQNYELCLKKGLNVIMADHRTVVWPKADFYYSYPYFHDVSRMMEICHKTLIIGSEPHKFNNFPPALSSQVVLDVLPDWRIAIWKRKE
jgi:hypothetical protein